MAAIIGITTDYQQPHPSVSSYSAYPWFALRKFYGDCLIAQKATPILLPPYEEAIDHYVSIIQGLVISGGGFDIDPSYYGEKIQVDNIVLNPTRGDFEFNLLKAFWATGKPILGICGGMQLINVFCKGSLWQDIKNQGHSPMNHSQGNPDLPHHDIQIIKKTRLYHLGAGISKTMVHTSHHQAIRLLGQNLIINAVAPDGVIEGIEHDTHPFCLGIQWHPEYRTSPLDETIWQEFTKACSTRHNRHYKEIFRPDVAIYTHHE